MPALPELRGEHDVPVQRRARHVAERLTLVAAVGEHGRQQREASAGVISAALEQTRHLAPDARRIAAAPDGLAVGDRELRAAAQKRAKLSKITKTLRPRLRSCAPCAIAT